MAKSSAFGTTLTMGPSGSAIGVAYVMGISGPGLSLDTEDVTTHDQATAWEEMSPTILRSGEVSLDMAFDPAAASHKAVASGMAYNLNQKALTDFVLTFPGSVAWDFSAYVTGFEPSAPVDGALTATAKLKISGSPTLR